MTYEPTTECPSSETTSDAVDVAHGAASSGAIDRTRVSEAGDDGAATVDESFNRFPQFTPTGFEDPVTVAARWCTHGVPEPDWSAWSDWSKWPQGSVIHTNYGPVTIGSNGPISMRTGKRIPTPWEDVARIHAEALLCAELATAFPSERTVGLEERDRWCFFFEPVLELDGATDWIVPNMGGWRRERLPSPSAEDHVVLPDWVAEIASPSRCPSDQAMRLEIYARNGIKHCWLVDPETQTLQAITFGDSSWQVMGTWQGRGRHRIAPFEAIELEIGVLWTSRRQTLSS